MPRPDPTEYASFYRNYVAQVPEDDVLPVLGSELETALALLRGVPEEEGNTRHAPYTWSVKEVVGHVTDAERVFAYRALRIGRGDTTPLPSFDENTYVRGAEFDRCRLADLVAEFEVVRRASLLLFRHFPEAAWSRRGIASNNEVTVRALAYIIVGHQRHHFGILRKRLGRA